MCCLSCLNQRPLETLYTVCTGGTQWVSLAAKRTVPVIKKLTSSFIHSQPLSMHILERSQPHLYILHQPLAGHIRQRTVPVPFKLIHCLLCSIRGCGWVVNQLLQQRDAYFPRCHCSIGHGVCAKYVGAAAAVNTPPSSDVLTVVHATISRAVYT